MENAMPAVQETIDQVRKIDVDQYKYGFETSIEMDKAPKGLNEDIIRFISAKKDEPEWMLEWRLGRVSPLADAGRADLGARRLSEDRFPGHLLLRRAEEHAGPDVARRGRSGTAEGLREARHSAEGAGDPRRRAARRRRVANSTRPTTMSTSPAASRSMRCSIRFPSSPPSRRSWPRPASSSARSRKRSASIPNW